MNDLIRTAAFRLSREHFGVVHVYRPGPDFCRVWEQLERQYRRTAGASAMARLPYRGLATALRVSSGDFVALQRQVAQGNAFVISRRPISRDQLAMAVGAWEVHALHMHEGPISNVLSDLTCEEVSVSQYLQHRRGLCPTIAEEGRWVWEVGIWEAAHRLAERAMQTDAGQVALRLDSDAALLTWNRLLCIEKRKGTYAAMHKVVLHLVTIPGVEEPVISLQSGLVRLAPTWRETGGARYAWADLAPDAPILRARVRNRRVGESFETLWDDCAAEVLQGVELEPLPDTATNPTLSGQLRTGYARSPRSHALGRGVGPWFHEYVARHATEALQGVAIPLQLKATRPRWPTAKVIAARPSLSFEEDKASLRIWVIYAEAEVRRRVRDALAHVLREDAHTQDQPHLAKLAERLNSLEDEAILRAGPLEVRFIKPPQAGTLLQRAERQAIRRWLGEWLPATDPDGVATAALIETDEGAANGDNELADPKQVLRGALAERGIVTQFITKASAPKPKAASKEAKDKFGDHAAAGAVNDLLRSAGFFLRPFPEVGGGTDTLVVGIYCIRATHKTTGRGASYLVNLVAASLGGRKAWGFAEGSGWVALHEATAWFLSSDHTLSEQQARERVERAVGQLSVAFRDKPVILLFDAFGCRRMWPCLTDKSIGEPEIWMKRDSKAIVRVRAVSVEVPRPAGTISEDGKLAPMKHTSFRHVAISGAQGLAPTFVQSGSAVMDQGKSARKFTRLAAELKNLKEDWHSLGSTELLALEPGRWERDELLEQVAMLCRVAPTWERTLRWPSPLHLARAVVRDHPHGYFAEAEEEEAEDSKPMRFDLD
jgi:hypothetical protein